jgi:hypothetical protein
MMAAMALRQAWWRRKARVEELDGEARERVELAARVVAWEVDRALEAGLRAAVAEGN